MIAKFNQFFKFIIAGANNTAIDFLILNILMNLSHIYDQWPVIIFNIFSFSLAVINSYLVNRYWTFSQSQNKKIRIIQLFLMFIVLLLLLNGQFLKINYFSIFLIVIFFSQVLYVNYYIVKNYLIKNKFSDSSSEFGKFVFLTMIGLIINSTILYFISSHINPMFGFSSLLWANMAKATATIICLFWNFFAYKIIVFKKAC